MELRDGFEKSETETRLAFLLVQMAEESVVSERRGYLNFQEELMENSECPEKG